MDSQNKVDMSLDEIIKLSKKEKKAKNQVGGGRGRGNAGRGGRGRGGNLTGRGRGGNLTGRGRGRKQQATLAQNISTKRNNNNMQGVNRLAMRGRGSVGRGRGIRGRGGLQKQNAASISSLNRKAITSTFKTVRGRGRGRGQSGQVFTNSNRNQTSNSPQNQAQRRQRLNAVKAQAALLRKKEMAVKKLQTAQRTMQDINKALQKTARGNLVDSKRGILTNTNQVKAQTGGRGRRKLLTGLMRQGFKGSNVSLVSNTSGRQMMNTSVTINNQAATINNQTANRRRRQWRPKQNSDVTVQVSNSGNRSNFNDKPTVQKSSAIIEQLKMLKPSVPTTYKFQKNVFSSSSTTTVSLNDRFSSSPPTSLSNNDQLEERKVFI